MFARDTMIFWRLLALAALIVQLAFAAGHVHPDHNANATAVASACNLAEADACPPLDHEDYDGECEICKALRLTYAVVLPALFELPHTNEVYNALDARRSVEAVATLGAHAFQARGPPSS